MTKAEEKKNLGTVHGLKVVDTWETNYVYGRMATVTINGVDLSIQFGKSKRLAEDEGEFLPAKVLKAKHVLWDFTEEKSYYKRGVRGHMFSYKNPQNGEIEHVIGIYGRFPEDHRIGICTVVPLLDLVKGTPVKMGDQIIRVGGRTLEELMRLKINLCKQIGKSWVLSQEEQAMIRMKREDDQRLHEEEKERRLQEREAKMRSILDRDKVTVFNLDGKKLYGYPVTSDEYPILPNKTPVVVFSGVTKKNGYPEGDPIETFFVSKGRIAGKKKSSGFEKFHHQTGVSWDDPTNVSIEAASIVLVVDGRREQHFMFTPSTLEALRQTGVNSGTIVAVEEPDESGCYPLISLKGDKVKELGRYPRAEV